MCFLQIVHRKLMLNTVIFVLYLKYIVLQNSPQKANNILYFTPYCIYSILFLSGLYFQICG